MLSLSNDGLFITRKRKKWKFAHFDSYPNCFSYNRGDNPAVVKKQLTTHFSPSQGATLEAVERPLVLELAAGNAQFSLELARRHPEKDFIAVDIKSDRLYTSAKQALEEGVDNIAFLRTHINELEKIFTAHCVQELWLTFPDPFPRKRSAKHRLSHVSFLQQYRKILKETGVLHFKTDNRQLFLWSLEQFVATKWHIQELTFDLHESNLPQEYKIMTHYERRFIEAGLKINLVSSSYHRQSDNC